VHNAVGGGGSILWVKKPSRSRAVITTHRRRWRLSRSHLQLHAQAAHEVLRVPEERHNLALVPREPVVVCAAAAAAARAARGHRPTSTAAAGVTTAATEGSRGGVWLGGLKHLGRAAVNTAATQNRPARTTAAAAAAATATANGNSALL